MMKYFKRKDHLTLRVETDDYGILYDPDENSAFVLNPVGVAVCEKLEDAKTVDEILHLLKDDFSDIPENADREIFDLMQSLIDKNLVEESSR